MSRDDRGRRTRSAIVEGLERRALWSATLAVGTNVDVSRLAMNESEPAIAVDPKNPTRLFAASVITDEGLMVSTSSDGGATWSARVVGDGTDALVPACCDPSVTFDSFGNLFMTYLADRAGIVVVSSVDGGKTFSTAAVFRGDWDQPTIAAGPGLVWVTMAGDRGVVAAGAAVTGLGAVGTFGRTRAIAGSGGGSFGDIAVGAGGAVTVAYQRPVGGQHASRLYVATDPDGLGPARFGRPVPFTTTNVGGFDEIPAQGGQRSIDAEVGLAYDRSGGVNAGRLYAVYTEEPLDESNDTDVYIRYSDNGGLRWSLPVRVNDDVGPASQFLPRIAIDQTTGLVGIAWLDARDDTGTGPDSTDAEANDDATMYAAVVEPVSGGGLAGSPNVRVGVGISNADKSGSSIAFGDYCGLDFDGGVMYPAWADNSSTAGGNPDGALDAFDIYTAAVHVVASGGEAAARDVVQSGPVPKARGGRAVAARGASALVRVTYTDALAIDSTSIGAGDLSVIGAGGTALAVELVRVVGNAARTSATAIYRVLAPGSAWLPEDNGTFEVRVRPNEVFASNGNAVTGGEPAGVLVVKAKPRRA